jgi:LPS sulfotransferase NodH
MSGNFLVFSLPRCGSTTLRRLLNCHSRVRCFEEPFNPFNYDGKYLWSVTDGAKLDETLQDIWRTHNGIKHTWDLDGWPFTSNRALNALLLLHPNHKVLYLRRRNLLRRLVSFHISNQTHVWGVFNDHDKRRVEDSSFGPMNIDDTRRRLDEEVRLTSYHRQLMVDSGSTFMDLWYEDLYNPATTVQRRIDILNQLFIFLGETPLAGGSASAQAAQLFDASANKLNSVSTYCRIPGIAEVEKQCGSDATGWLFEDGAVR